jgi:hypothetical protein
LYSQTEDYYTGKTEVQGTDYKYNLTFKDYKGYSVVTVSNPANTKIGKPIILPSGEVVTVLFSTPWLSPVEEDKVVTIFREIFSEEEICKFKESSINIGKMFKYDRGLYLGIRYVVDMEGNILELDFFFNCVPVLLSINPDKLYQLEQKLKDNYKFIIYDSYKSRYTYLTGKTSCIYFEEL